MKKTAKIPGNSTKITKITMNMKTRSEIRVPKYSRKRAKHRDNRERGPKYPSKFSRKRSKTPENL